MSRDTATLNQEQTANIERFLADIANADRNMAEANRHLLADAPATWVANGNMATSGIGYMYIGGNLKLDSGKDLHFEGHTGGLAAGGGWGIGKATFYVSQDELLNGSVLVTVASANIIGGGIVVTWSRNFKKLGVFVGAGMGVGGGESVGSGAFSLR